MTRTSTRYESRLRPRLCPSCQSPQIADILYGVPYFDDQLEADLAAGRVTLGGTQTREDPPAWRCLECQAGVHQTAEASRQTQFGRHQPTAR